MNYVKEIVMRERIDHADDEMLYRIAIRCARCTIPEHQRNVLMAANNKERAIALRQSVHEWPRLADECQGCQFNLNAYTTPARAALLRADAQLHNEDVARNAKWIAQYEKSQDWSWLVPVALVVLVVVFFGWAIRQGQKMSYASMPASVSVQQTTTYRSQELTDKFGITYAERQRGYVEKDGVSYTYIGNGTWRTGPLGAQKPVRARKDIVAADVRAALHRVQAHVYDSNGDGVINCQDYARQFVKEYPGAIIIFNPYINEPGQTGGHVFNYVKIDDVEGGYYIEPQRTVNWLMREAWPQWNEVMHANEYWRFQ
jgi:hypothetical protein